MNVPHLLSALGLVGLAALPLLFSNGEAVASTTAAPASPAATTYAIDGGHSSVVFKVRHFGLSNFYGSLEEVGGEIVVDSDAKKSSVKIEIATASVHSRDAKRDSHITSPDFFNAAEFPTASFESTKVKAKGKDKYEVEGTFSLRGVEKTLTAVVEKIGEGESPFGDERIGFEARFTINMGDFEMPVVEKMGPEKLGHDVDMIVAIEAVKQ